jgi:hypothetical protein
VVRTALLALVVAASPCWAQSKLVVPFKAEIVEVGVYEVVGTVAQRPAPGTASGTASEHEELQLIQVGTQVKATRGTTFGFRYRVSNVADGSIQGLQLRALHPPMRGPDGRVNSSSTASTEVLASGGEARGDVAYTLSEPFEVLRGDWELQLLYAGRVILSQRFTLQ